MVWLLRFVLLFLIIFFFYMAFKFLFTSKRKLESARRQKRFLLIDNQDDVRKNFLLTYKGAVFAGEKYMGTTESTIDIVSIFIWPENTALLKGLAKEDFYFMEKKILEHYPNSELIWKSPIKELLQSN